MSYKKHLFICTAGHDPNSQGNPKKCGGKGSDKLRAELKETCKNLYGKDVRVNSAGCLGYCEKGITAVIYPQNEWFYELTDQDSSKLLDALEKHK